MRGSIFGTSELANRLVNWGATIRAPPMFFSGKPWESGKVVRCKGAYAFYGLPLRL